MSEPTFPRVGHTDNGVLYVEYATGECDSSIGWDEPGAQRCADSHDANGNWLRTCDDCGSPAGLWQPPWDDLEPYFSCTREECASANNSPAEVRSTDTTEGES